MSEETPLWTIEELANRVATALASGYSGSSDNRVRDVPDQRNIRYYTTLGLLDRPTMRGRTALYGVRHLLQIAAIKRLQAARWPLAKIQQALLNLKDQELAEIAQVRVEAAQPAKEEVRARGDFWKEIPATSVSEIATVEPDVRTASPAVRLGGLQGIDLTGDVALLMRPARPLEDEDIQAIRSVAGPLLELLHQRRLLARAEKGNSHDPAAADPV
jgi:DNA-binding transcriptional MerR regulator